MPTYRHACPQCETFIERTVAACPACGFVDPFGPDAARRAVGAATPPPARSPAAQSTAAAPARACTGCGTALAPGARFCEECGTLVGQ